MYVCIDVQCGAHCAEFYAVESVML